MGKKVIITGAGGYIASHATDIFLKNGYTVVAVDDFSAGFREPLDLLKKEYGEDKLKVYEIDLTTDKVHEVFEQEKDIAAVVHFAGVASVDESMHNPFKYFKINSYGTENLIETMLTYGVNNLIFSSSCVTYGEAEYIPVDENHPQKPENPYGESKLHAEKAIKWYGRLKGLNFLIFRYFNVSGCHDEGKIGDSQRPSIRLVQNAVRGALGLGSFSLTCNKVDTPDGTPIRDIINVVDLVEAHLLGVEYLVQGGDSEIINLGTGTGNSVLEIVDYTQKVTGHDFEFSTGGTRQGEYARMVSSITKAEKVLGWKPKRSMKDTIDSLVAWYTKRPEGWEY